MATTSFEDWTSLLDLDNYEEVDSLYQSVQNISEYGLYKTVVAKKDGSYVVTAANVDDCLFLASEDARGAFLRFIENKYCGGEMEAAWYAINRSNDRED